MLVLTRKVGQSICFGDDIEITVHKITGKRVTLSVTAPDAVDIKRGELKDSGSSGELPD